MRIDKYLWCVRLFKTRSLASENVKSNKILIDGELVKASRDVKVGQEIGIKKHGYQQTYKVLGWPKSRVGAKLVADFLVETTSKENLEKKAFLELAHSIGRKRGLGRPTKKDRRDIDDIEILED